MSTDVHLTCADWRRLTRRPPDFVSRPFPNSGLPSGHEFRPTGWGLRLRRAVAAGQRLLRDASLGSHWPTAGFQELGVAGDPARGDTFGAGERDLSRWIAAHARVSWTGSSPWIIEAQLIADLDLPAL